MKRALLLFVLQSLIAAVYNPLVHSQPMGPMADCDQGWAIPPRVDPRDRYIHCMSYWGMMEGSISECANPNHSESYAIKMMALGDLNGDNIADWGVERNRCDTQVNGRVPVEWLIYHGVRGGLPTVESGERIGPSEIGSKTQILCTGDWDDDGHEDIATHIEFPGDTTGGNTQGYETDRLVIFWGKSEGRYSVEDTTQIPCEAEIWLGLRWASGSDLDGDAIDDLFVWGASGLSHGNVVLIPEFRIHRGGVGRRWGRNGVSYKPDWWWIPSLPEFDRIITTLDHDCDGHRDIIFFSEDRAEYTQVTVLYGRAGQLPDTIEAQTVDMTNANAHFMLVADLTGDNVPELTVNCGSQEMLKVYAGKAGQRLLEQYGDGLSPWARVWLPLKIHDGWFSAGFTPLYDFGDGDGDGISDIWVYSPPFMLGYTGAGKWLDSLIDIAFRWGNVNSMSKLGDIDGSGQPTFAVGFSGKPGGVAFYKANDSAYHFGTILRKLSHAEGEQCGQSADVSVPAVMPEMKERPELTSLPEPHRQ